MKCGGRSSFARADGCGRGEGQALAIAEPMGEPGERQEAAVESAVRAEPAGAESVPAQGEPGPAVDLSLRRRHAALSENWMDQLRWQRLKPFEKLAQMLLDHLEGILNYCRTKVSMGVVEAVNGNIKSLLRRGRGYRNLHYLLLKARRMAATKTEFVAFRKAA